METVRITLPHDLKAFVDDQVLAGAYSSPDAYFVSLIDEARKCQEKAILLKLVREARESGPATPVTPKVWEDMRQEVRKRLNKKKAKQPQK